MAILRRAYNVLPTRFGDDRHGAIVEGWRRQGFQIVDGYGPPRSPDDVLLTWTVHRGEKERRRDEFEARGGRVAVYEEAYIKPSFFDAAPRAARIFTSSGKHFAAAWHDHNGAGVIPWGGRERWQSWGLTIAPWRPETITGHILVREQRGIGSTLQACPPAWHQAAAAELRRYTSREIRIRLHPKHDPDPTPDSERFKNCHAVATWNSSIAFAALLAGIPVISCATHCLADLATGHELDQIENPYQGSRREMFERSAWAQWSLDELRSGYAIDHLLSV